MSGCRRTLTERSRARAIAGEARKNSTEPRESAVRTLTELRDQRVDGHVGALRD